MPEPVDVRKDVDGMRHIYGRALSITMVRDYGKHKGDTFKHKCEPGNRIMGLHEGTVIRTPDGHRVKLKHRAILIISNDKDLWDDFVY